MSPGAMIALIIERAGFFLGALAGFLIIFAIGLIALWITGEPYH